MTEPSPGTPMSPNFTETNQATVDASRQQNPTMLVGSRGTDAAGNPIPQYIQTGQSGGLLQEPSPAAETRESARNTALVAAVDRVATAIGGNAVGDGTSITAASPFSTIGASGGPYRLATYDGGGTPTGSFVTFTVVNGLITVIGA